MKIVKASWSLAPRDEERGGLAVIEQAARTCYKSEGAIGEGSAEKIVGALIRKGHESALEHGDYIFRLDDAHILDNVAEALMAIELDTGHRIRLSLTRENRRPIVSGNIRAWRELMAADSIVKYYFTGAIDPLYIADLVPENERYADDRVHQIRYADLKGPAEQRAHLRQTARFVIDRGISHEFVRHRVFSFSQESTRYCVAGDTRLTMSNSHINGMTVEELYRNRMESGNGAWKRMRVRQYNEETGELQFAGIREIVCNGEKACVRLKTKLGYELVCTADHRILTPDGYREAGEIAVGSRVYVNGTDALYMNRDWLFHQSITLNKTFKAIAEEFGFNVSTIKNWARKLNIPKKGTGYFNIGRTPWNKGITDERQTEALRTFHHCGRRKEGIMKPDTVNYQKHMGTSCEVCGATEGLEVHHTDKNRNNNDPANLMTVCESCHQRIHSQNLLTAYADDVIEIVDAGVQTVYDIEMDSEHHNFAANGVIVHNCNYSQDKFGREITVIQPCYLADGTAPYDLWKRQCMSAETAYFTLLNLGRGAAPQISDLSRGSFAEGETDEPPVRRLSAEEARAVLPTSTKTELMMTGTLGDWRHFLELRALETTGKVHPQAKEVAAPLMTALAVRYPEAFGRE